MDNDETLKSWPVVGYPADAELHDQEGDEIGLPGETHRYDEYLLSSSDSEQSDPVEIQLANSKRRLAAPTELCSVPATRQRQQIYRTPLSKERTPTSDVFAMGKMILVGNITPRSWYVNLRRPSGQADLVACSVLSEIVWWYLPSRNPANGEKGEVLCRKFVGDLLQKSYGALAASLALSRKQVQQAVERLEARGLIRRVVRSVAVGSEVYGNRLFIQIFPEAIEEISGDADCAAADVPSCLAGHEGEPAKEDGTTAQGMNSTGTTHQPPRNHKKKSPKPPFDKGGPSIPQELTTITPGNDENEKSDDSCEITTGSLPTLPNSADPRFPKLGRHPDWSGAVEKFDLENAKTIARLFSDGERFWDRPALARTYWKQRVNGFLNERKIALLGRFYGEGHSDDVPSSEWKTSTVERFLDRRVIAKSISVVVSHVGWKIKVIRDDIHLRQSSDGFRSYIFSARRLLSGGETLSSVIPRMERNPGSVAASLIAAAEMKMDLGACRDKWREFVERDFAAFHGLREYYRRGQIDPVAVFGLNDAEIDAIIEADVAWAREEEAELVAFRDGSPDPLSQGKVPSL